MSVIGCDEGCTSHSNEVHDAIRTLQACRSPIHNQWASSNWTLGYSAWSLAPAMYPEPGGISWPVADPGQVLAQVPVTQAMGDAELLMIFVKFISQFTASLDGKPDASNPYIKYYVPYCVNSQLLSRVAIFSAACFLTDTGHLERTVAMDHRGHVIKLLNEHIRSQLSTSDEVIAGVCQLVLDEWLWGNTDDLHAHRRGLHEMIRSRGGFRMLGLHGMISKLAITCDAAIALSFEASPFLQGGPEFEFGDNSHVPLRLALNTPLISTLPRFSSCADPLRIHPAVASILDDMRFLLAAVLALPEKPSAKELQKVHTTSAWIHERISGLPEDAPTSRRPSTAGPTPSRGSSAVAEPWEGHSSRGRPHSNFQHPRHQSQAHPGRRPSTPTPAPTPSPQNYPQPQAPPPAYYPTTTSPPGQAQAQDPDPDPIYQATRLAALLYTHAISRRQPFSATVTPAQFHDLWATAWRVPLSTWRSLLGVLNWILLPLVSSGGGKSGQQPHDRFVKGMVNLSLFQIGLEDWEVGRQVLERGARLQGWLAGGGAAGSAGAGKGGSPSEVPEGGGMGGLRWRAGGGSPGGGYFDAAGVGDDGGSKRRSKGIREWGGQNGI